MKIVSAEYVKSFVDPNKINVASLPSIAFIGRSNVGKSSLINHLLNKKKLVKTSSTPGKTQMINYFLVNGLFHFVDLPGYGYAKVPERVRDQWFGMITEFLLRDVNLKLVVLIVDARRPPTKDDSAFHSLLKDNTIPTLVVANKVDKLKRSQLPISHRQIIKTLEPDTSPVSHSSLKRIGRDEIWKHLNIAIKA